MYDLRQFFGEQAKYTATLASSAPSPYKNFDYKSIEQEVPTTLTSFESQDRDRDHQEERDPDNGGHEAHVHLGVRDGPAAREDRPQRSGGQRQRQAQGHVAQHPGHALDRPDHAAQQQRGVERAQCQLDGVALQLAGGRDHEAEAHATQPWRR